jgi:hypothetical protein
MYTIFNLTSGDVARRVRWRVRDRDHDDREWQAIVDRLRAEIDPAVREPLVMRILHRTSHAAVFTVPLSLDARPTS